MVSHEENNLNNRENGNDRRLKEAINKFIRDSKVEREELIELLERTSKYAQIIKGNIIKFTNKGNKLILKQKIILYALAKYLATQVRQFPEYASKIAITEPSISVKEVSTFLNTSGKVISARVSELVKLGLLKCEKRGIYILTDPKEALYYIEGQEGED